MSKKRRTAGIYSSAAPRGPNGERLCRNCHGPMPKGIRHNCSPECSKEWRCKTSPWYLRMVLRERDRGVCVICGLDTTALKAAVNWVCEHLYKANRIRWFGHEEWWNFQKAIGVPGRWPGDLWDADHIVPVIEGGGECGLDNYRTLCIPCHKKETAALAAKRAKERRQKRPLPLFDKGIV